MKLDKDALLDLYDEHVGLGDNTNMDAEEYEYFKDDLFTFVKAIIEIKAEELTNWK